MTAVREGCAVPDVVQARALQREEAYLGLMVLSLTPSRASTLPHLTFVVYKFGA